MKIENSSDHRRISLYRSHGFCVAVASVATIVSETVPPGRPKVARYRSNPFVPRHIGRCRHHVAEQAVQLIELEPRVPILFHNE